ncbi:MAG TPA: hypothetical protein VIM86_01730, partial [Thermodesulfobacteriota bacterium]
MGEPEGLLIEASRIATVAARDLWRRARPPGDAGGPRLADLRRRLELLVAAVFRIDCPIVAADPPHAPNWLARLARRTPPHLVVGRPLAGTDGTRIRLPPDLDPQASRILALEQGARAARGTPRRLPPAGPLRDLYL